jgi:hypothetical protein
LLSTIRGNRIGDIIVSGIEGIKGRELTIVPWDAGKAASLGGTNAAAVADNEKDAAPNGVSGDLVGESGWYRGHGDNPKTVQDERYDRMPSGEKGTGKGSSVHIYFSPDKSAMHGKPSWEADEVLLHEMVHALRKMQGKSNPIPTENTLQKYDNEEEFLAIVVTNVYMSVNNKTRLAADHQTLNVLDSSLSTSFGFLENRDNLRLMNIYKLLWQPTFWLLHTVPAIFNPFRELTLRLDTPFSAFRQAFDSGRRDSQSPSQTKPIYPLPLPGTRWPL